MLYTIRKPPIGSVAVVKRPASGHRFHLLKEAGTMHDYDDLGLAGGLATLAKHAGDREPLAKGLHLAGLGRLAQRVELPKRVARHLSVGQTRGPHAAPWPVNAATASVDEHVPALERLAAGG